VNAILEFVEGLPPVAVYAALGLGAALENLFPPVPADTFVLLGGFLAGRGTGVAWIVWLATWSCNVVSALLVYGVGRRYGPIFFEVGMGRHVLDERQMRRMARFYARWGYPAIFLTRFLPGLRAVVPAFAGVSRRPFLPVAVPVVLASGVWYGGLVWVGATAGQNLEALLAALDRLNRGLLVAAVVVGALVAYWWVRTRRRP
jgi:membrane protein DedA with SNARE-associated domain